MGIENLYKLTFEIEANLEDIIIWKLNDLSQIKEIDLKKTIEFKTFELAIEYLFSLEKWPHNHPVLTGSIFLVAEFIKFTNKQKC